MNTNITKQIYARALFDNVPEIPRELSFKKGDILTVLQESYDKNPEWWVCSIRTKVGLAPANRLEAMPVLSNAKPSVESLMSSSTYDEIPEPPAQSYFNIQNDVNISSLDETYSAYQFPKEDVYSNSLLEHRESSGNQIPKEVVYCNSPSRQLDSFANNDEQSVYQLPSDQLFDETYSNINETSPKSHLNTLRVIQPMSSKGSLDNEFYKNIVYCTDLLSAAISSNNEISTTSSELDDSSALKRDTKAQLILSPEEAIAKYRQLQTNTVDSCNQVLSFVNSKWKTEETLKLNVNSVRQCFRTLHDNLVILLNFVNNVYQNSLNCNDINLTKKIGKHLSQLQENMKTLTDSLKTLDCMSWEPEKIAISVRLAVSEGSDALGQAVLVARNLLINTRSISVTINGNAVILFPVVSTNEIVPVEDNESRYNIVYVLKLFSQQIQSQTKLVNESIDDFIRFLSNRNCDFQFLKILTSNSRFVIRSSTQLICIAKNLSDTHLKSVPCDKIECATNKLCYSLKSMANITSQLNADKNCSNDQKDQLNRYLKTIQDCVNNLLEIVVQSTA